MSADQVAILTAVLKIVNTMSGWPFGLLFFAVVIGPWVLALMLGYSYRRRFESVVTMYERNVSLVEKYEKVAIDLKDVIILNTQTITTLIAEFRASKGGG